MNQLWNQLWGNESQNGPTLHRMEQRGLSLLGKIKFFKTFGLSQYLYTQAVIDITTEQWKIVNKLIYKFIWNKTYSTNNAPHRINSILTSLQTKFWLQFKLNFDFIWTWCHANLNLYHVGRKLNLSYFCAQNWVTTDVMQTEFDFIQIELDIMLISTFILTSLQT